MIKNKLKDVKALIIKKTDGNNKKNIENLIVFLVLLIVTIIAINSIWGKKEESKKENTTNYKELAKTDINSNITENTEYNLENELEDILSKIYGVGKVKALITYSETSQVVAMYDEKVKTSTTEETDTNGGSRNVQESDISKEIKVDGENSPITQKVIMPLIEGAIIIAEGADNATIKTNIIQAVSAVTGLSTYKVQVFKME